MKENDLPIIPPGGIVSRIKEDVRDASLQAAVGESMAAEEGSHVIGIHKNVVVHDAMGCSHYPRRADHSSATVRILIGA